MEKELNSTKETALLNLYGGYLLESGIDTQILLAQNSESLDLLQIKLADNGNLNILFVPLGEGNFKTLAVIQFFAQWEQVKRSKLDSLILVNALNQKVPLAKLSINSENTLEYHYYIPVSLHTPLTKEEFMERVSLVLSQIEVIYEIWLQDEPACQLIEKLNQE